MNNTPENIESSAKTPQTKSIMPKWLKVTLISLGSLLGVIALVLVIACYLIFTPARLTSIVNQLSDKYILCESHFEKVNLTLFRTFPDAGLEVKQVVLVNPIANKASYQVSDTLAKLQSLTIAINVRDYLKNGNIKVHKLLVDDVQANLFIDPAGKANFDIFPPSTDTTPSKPFQMPDIVNLKKIKISSLNATYIDCPNGARALATNADLCLKGSWQQSTADADLQLKTDQLILHLNDSTNTETLATNLHNLDIDVSGNGPFNNLNGNLAVNLSSGTLKMGNTEWINPTLRKHTDLLKIDLPFTANLDDKDFTVRDASIALTQYIINLSGSIKLPNPQRDLAINVNYNTNKWPVAELLTILPPQFTSWSKGMNLDAKLKLSGRAKGTVNDTVMPLIDAKVQLIDGKFIDHKLIPYDLNNINADIDASLNLSKDSLSRATINYINAVSGHNDIALNGTLENLLGNMLADVTLRANLQLPDLMPLMPKDTPLDAKGRAKLKLRAKAYMDQITAVDLKNIKVKGSIDFTDLNVQYNDISANSPALSLSVQIPAASRSATFRELGSVRLKSGKLHAKVSSSNIDANINGANLVANISDIMDSTQPFSVSTSFKFDKIDATLDSIRGSLTEPAGTFSMIPDRKNPAKVHYVIDYNNSALFCKINDSVAMNVAGLSIKGDANYDSTRANVLQQWSPNINVDFKRGYINVAQLPYMIQIPDIKFNYRPERCEIASANIVFGNSDYYLSGAVTGLEKWISHEDMLHGDLHFTSNYTNVDDLLSALSGMGTNADTLAQQRAEDHVKKEANPFIVPLDVDFTLHTRIKEATAYGNEIQELAGDIKVRDGVAVLDQVGFVCKAARMQLTALYKTPRVNHIFVGLDFHLLDIGISQLIDMIPYVDTLVPMLASFDGNANFHLCAETYVDAFYKPKMSTLRGAAAISGDSLVVLDNETFDKISKLMLFKRSTKNVIDSLDVEMTVFRKEVEIYPFLLSMDRYQVVAAGRHNVDMNYDYHLEILHSPLPTRLAVDVLGVMPKLNFTLSKCRYAELYKPEKRNSLQEQTMQLKQLIRQSLEANVKESTRTYKGLD